MDLFNQQGQRWVWIHKDECEFNAPSTDERAYSIPVTPVCINDYFEIAITMHSLMGSL